MSSTKSSKHWLRRNPSLFQDGGSCLLCHNGERDCCMVSLFRCSLSWVGSVGHTRESLNSSANDDILPDVIGYYQVIMYKALGFTGGKAILISGIYNCVGPVSSKCLEIKPLTTSLVDNYFRFNLHCLPSRSCRTSKAPPLRNHWNHTGIDLRRGH